MMGHLLKDDEECITLKSILNVIERHKPSEKPRKIKLNIIKEEVECFKMFN